MRLEMCCVCVCACVFATNWNEVCLEICLHYFWDLRKVLELVKIWFQFPQELYNHQLSSSSSSSSSARQTERERGEIEWVRARQTVYGALNSFEKFRLEFWQTDKQQEYLHINEIWQLIKLAQLTKAERGRGDRERGIDRANLGRT